MAIAIQQLAPDYIQLAGNPPSHLNCPVTGLGWEEAVHVFFRTKRGRPWSAHFARIMLLGNQPAMPRQQRVWSHDAGEAPQTFSTDEFVFECESVALIVLEPRTFPQLLLERADFLLEEFDDRLLVAVHPAGDEGQEKGQGTHGEILPPTRLLDQHFPERPPSPHRAKARKSQGAEPRSSSRIVRPERQQEIVDS